jgi:uncharacterized Fe-S cluster-containing protein
MTTYTVNDLPGLNCGTCGLRSCDEMAVRLESDPSFIKRCIYLSDDRLPAVQEQQTWVQPIFQAPVAAPAVEVSASPCAGCGAAAPAVATAGATRPSYPLSSQWRDSLGREFDFILEHFPEEPGPREIIIPHNPMITREMDIQVGDILIGRPLGMSCGCPITHCGVAVDVDKRTGVIVWCVTGPLNPRQKGYKDLGYYIAEGYEGLVHKTNTELKIGMRYFFQPERCMLQWRHSGLVNFLNRIPGGYQVRVEGLWIG